VLSRGLLLCLCHCCIHRRCCLADVASTKDRRVAACASGSLTACVPAVVVAARASCVRRVQVRRTQVSERACVRAVSEHCRLRALCAAVSTNTTYVPVLLLPPSPSEGMPSDAAAAARVTRGGSAAIRARCAAAVTAASRRALHKAHTCFVPNRYSSAETPYTRLARCTGDQPLDTTCPRATASQPWPYGHGGWDGTP
jgi:hypothetical protein